MILTFNLIILMISMMSMMINNFLILWMNIEICTMMFIFLMSTKKNLWNNNIKYFLIQSISSNFMLFSMLNMNFINMNSYMYMWMNLLFNLSMIMKIGMFPFHSWFPKISSNLNWMNFFSLSTILKIIPMYMLTLFMNNKIIMMSCILSSSMAVLMTLTEMNLKKFMSYSSINHTSWMMILTMINYNIWLIYLMIYINLTWLICKTLKKFNINKNMEINKIKINKFNKFLFLIMLMNSGLPPFISFMTKWFSMENMNNNFMMLTLLVLIMSSVMILYSYTRLFMIMSLNMYLTNNINFYTNNKNKMLLIKNKILFMNLFMLLTLPFIMNL